MIERWSERVAFLEEWIANLSRKTIWKWLFPRLRFANADKRYQLEEELMLKKELIRRWHETQENNSKAEEEQKQVLLKELPDKLNNLRKLKIEGKLAGKAKEAAEGILERNGKGSHRERWSDYNFAKGILAQVPNLVKA